ncbi:PREDICTED: uncharacterized protein LOC104805452 [Tarenaya hassleriana]|uniref:uncharacterized protein LOC104805452 n=1 Tax=Tarenaya hassleriana TaxID=28532 RepID=UPI00053C0C73|nr:PREDICTED: uncharacterized protein LOC104805452 [Tarenaya hassleriana]
MARTYLYSCFAVLFVSGALLDIVSPTFLPNIEEPKTVKDVEPYTVKVVMSFAFNLEKECPKTQEFKEFFLRLKAFSKYVCPISQVLRRRGSKDIEFDMKAKAGSLFQAISSFAARKSESREAEMALKSEQREAMNVVGSVQSIASKFLNRRKEAKIDESMELTEEQKQAVKDRIIKWEQVITRVVKTMVQSSSQSSSQSQSSHSSSVNVNGGSEASMNAEKGDEKTSGKAQTTETPRGSANSAKKESSKADSSKDASVEVNGDKDSAKDKTTDNKGGVEGSSNGNNTLDTKGSGEAVAAESSKTESKESASSIDGNTSDQVMGFIINLEKKCPQTEEFKSFFEKMKVYMKYACSISSTAAKKNPRSYMSEMITIASKLSNAMQLVQSRMSKSQETKNAMQSYQEEMMKTLNALQEVTKNVVKENESKQEGAVTVTQTQQKVFKETITRWEQVTTQFVETAVESEAQSSTKTQSSSQ